MSTIHSEHGTLMKEQVANYTENGYLLLKGVLQPEEAVELRREAHELIERLRRQRSIDATWGSARMVQGERRLNCCTATTSSFRAQCSPACSPTHDWWIPSQTS